MRDRGACGVLARRAGWRAASGFGLGTERGIDTDSSLNGRELKIGSDTTYPPFEIVDAEKKIVGFDPDLVAEICRRANCKATFVTAAFDGIFAALSQGPVGAVVSGVTITDERKKNVDFSESYLRYGQVVLVRADETG